MARLLYTILLHHFVTDPTKINGGKDVGNFSFVRVSVFGVLMYKMEKCKSSITLSHKPSNVCVKTHVFKHVG